MDAAENRFDPIKPSEEGAPANEGFGDDSATMSGRRVEPLRGERRRSSIDSLDVRRALEASLTEKTSIPEAPEMEVSPPASPRGSRLDPEAQKRHNAVRAKINQLALQAKKAAALHPFEQELASKAADHLTIARVVREVEHLAQQGDSELPSLGGTNPVTKLSAPIYLPRADVAARIDRVLLARTEIESLLTQASDSLRQKELEGCAESLHTLHQALQEDLDRGVTLDVAVDNLISGFEDLNWGGEPLEIQQKLASDINAAVTTVKPHLFTSLAVEEALGQAIDELNAQGSEGNAEDIQGLRTSFSERIAGGESLTDALEQMLSVLSEKEWMGDAAAVLDKLNNELANLPTRGDFAAHLPAFYRKDELLDALRLQADREAGDVTPEVHDAIETVKRHRGAFVDAAVLEGLDGTPKTRVVKTLTPYVASEAVEKALGSSPRVAVIVKDIARERCLDQPEFVFKMGLETISEDKAAMLAKAFGLDPHLVRKRPVKVQGITISGTRGGRGIASRFIQKTADFPAATWVSYCKTRQQLAAASFKRSQQDAPDATLDAEIERLSEEMARSNDELVDLGGKDSVVDHALVDLLFRSYDSHPQQYIYNGEFEGIDLARLGSPARAYRAKVTVRKKEVEETFLPMRSTFLWHPFVLEALPREKVNQLLSIDVDHIETQLRKGHVIGDAAEFETAAKWLDRARGQLTSMEDCYVRLRAGGRLTDDELAALENTYAGAKRLGLMVPEGLTRNEPEALLRACFRAVKEKQYADTCKIFAQIHPKAWEMLKQDFLALQGYLREHRDNAIIREAVGVIDPDLNAILNVAQRLPGFENPFESISHGAKAFRSLEQVVRTAEELSEPVATKEEMDAMKAAVARYKAGSCSEALLATTMSVFPENRLVE